MTTKQRNVLNNQTPVSLTAHQIEGSSKLPDTPSTINGKAIDADAGVVLTLQKKEEANAYLEELVESGKNKLNEVVATNARFIKIIAHDLRNPLSTTIGILDLLKENHIECSNAEIMQLINTAYNSANRTLNLLENLLAWSTSQNLEKNFNPVKINLRELVVNEIEHSNSSATLKQINLDHSVGSDLHVTADFEMVKTIFRNLINNAIKYTNTNGSVFIAATEGKKFVKIEISDNGIGMSIKTKGKLFKIDEIHSISGTNNEQGTGLGLLFCKEFIDLHGGKILVESEPGIGSVFRFTLPHYI
jgi:signal transduction histidine kinase